MTCTEARDDELVARLRGLRSGDLLTIVGLEAAALAGHIPTGSPRLLRLDLAGAAGHGAALACVLDDLAALALATWPAWPQSSLPPWGRAAGRLAAAGRPPRFRQVARETQFPELILAAGSPTLLFTLDPIRPERAGPLIAASEWCRRHGAVVIALLAEAPEAEPPWDRVLHDALAVARAPEPVTDRLLPPSSATPRPRGSAIEKRMREAIAADPELAGLFEDEVTLRLGPLGPTPRVDLLWRGGKVVVELDGAEHERDPTYGADRHRDYELLVAGYLVLRLTNAEVDLDLGRSLDKVRRVIALRRPAA